MIEEQVKAEIVPNFADHRGSVRAREFAGRAASSSEGGRRWIAEAQKVGGLSLLAAGSPSSVGFWSGPGSVR